MLKQQEVIKSIQNVLQSNVSVCTSLGQPFVTQMTFIYTDMLQVRLPGCCLLMAGDDCAVGAEGCAAGAVRRAARPVRCCASALALSSGGTLKAAASLGLPLRHSASPPPPPPPPPPHPCATQPHASPPAHTPPALQVYKLYSEMISTTITEGGPHAARCAA